MKAKIDICIFPVSREYKKFKKKKKKKKKKGLNVSSTRRSRYIGDKIVCDHIAHGICYIIRCP